MWYLFDSEESFDAWHELIKIRLGIPMSDGITTAYTQIMPSYDGRLVVWVDEEYAEGLTPTDPPTYPPKHDPIS